MNNLSEQKIAIIIPCKNEGIYIKQTLEFLLETEAKYIADIIIVDDNSNDNCCEFLKSESLSYHNVSFFQTKGIGPSLARNLGAAAAASAKFLVFCDAHITMNKGWLQSIIKTFQDPEISAVCPGIGSFNPHSPIGYGQTWNENFEIYWLKRPNDIKEIPIAPGGCFAIRKNVFDSVGGFDRGFYSWGFEDVELSLKLWLFGYKIVVHPDIRIGHKFRKIQPYNINLTEYYYNKFRMILSHFNADKTCRLMNSLNEYSNFEEIVKKLTNSDVYRQREDYFNRRVHNDDWFFKKFKIPF